MSFFVVVCLLDIFVVQFFFVGSVVVVVVVVVLVVLVLVLVLVLVVLVLVLVLVVVVLGSMPKELSGLRCGLVRTLKLEAQTLGRK